MRDYELDPEELDKFAADIMARPSDMGVWDDRVYTTHGGTFAWAERGNDTVSESNYRTILAHLQSVAEDEEDVIDGTFGHWAVGSLRQIFVKVYEGKTVTVCAVCHEDVTVTEHGTCLGNGETYEEIQTSNVYTEAFKEAYRVYLALQDYPIFDESDWSELEWEQTEQAYDDAVAYLLNYDEEFPDELDEETLNELREVWSDAYGYAEDGWVHPDSIKQGLDEARRRVLLNAGQTELEGL